MQADPYIQEPTFTQSLNRYAYVWNNPLNATDPSGYFVGAIIGHLIGSELTRRFIQSSWIGKNVIQPALQYVSRKPILNAIVTIVIAYYGGPTAVAAYSEAVTYANGGSLLDGVKAGAISYASSYAFAAVGEAFPVIGESGVINWNNLAPNAIGHGLVGGAASELSGGKFGHGFISAFASSAAKPLIFGKFGTKPENRTARTITAAIVGGTASVATGGKFANGALTSALSWTFNAESNAKEIEKNKKFDELWDKYQGKSEMFKNIKIHPANKSLIEKGGSCATRMCNAFNRAGFDDELDGLSGYFTDQNGNRYIMSAPKLAEHLGVSLEKNVITSVKDLTGKQGIIFFQKTSGSSYQHIDLVKGGVMRGNNTIRSRFFKSKVYFKEIE